jgi:hypothetical protein
LWHACIPHRFTARGHWRQHRHPHAISAAPATSWPVASASAATAVSGDLTALALPE